MGFPVPSATSLRRNQTPLSGITSSSMYGSLSLLHSRWLTFTFKDSSRDESERSDRFKTFLILVTSIAILNDEMNAVFVCLGIEPQRQYAAGSKLTINTTYKLFGRKRKKRRITSWTFQRKKLIFCLFLALSLLLFHTLNALCTANVKSLLFCLRAHPTGGSGKGWEIEIFSCMVNSGRELLEVKSVRFTQRSGASLLSFASLPSYHHLYQ